MGWLACAIARDERDLPGYIMEAAWSALGIATSTANSMITLAESAVERFGPWLDPGAKLIRDPDSEGLPTRTETTLRSVPSQRHSDSDKKASEIPLPDPTQDDAIHILRRGDDSVFVWFRSAQGVPDGELCLRERTDPNGDIVREHPLAEGVRHAYIELPSERTVRFLELGGPDTAPCARLAGPVRIPATTSLGNPPARWRDLRTGALVSPSPRPRISGSPSAASTPADRPTGDRG